MIILVDFDNTLCDGNNVQRGYRMGPPTMGAIDSMRRLSIGNELIIFTGRRVDVPNVYDAVQKWLEYFQIPYHSITNVKPERYDLIIDDKAMHFDDWPRVMVRLTRNDNPPITDTVEF